MSLQATLPVVRTARSRTEDALEEGPVLVLCDDPMTEHETLYLLREVSCVAALLSGLAAGVLLCRRPPVLGGMRLIVFHLLGTCANVLVLMMTSAELCAHTDAGGGLVWSAGRRRFCLF